MRGAGGRCIRGGRRCKVGRNGGWEGVTVAKEGVLFFTRVC